MRLLIAFFLLVLSQGLSAAAFKVLYWSGDLPDLYYAFSQEYVPIKASSRKFSQIYELAADQPLQLFTRQKGEGGDFIYEMKLDLGPFKANALPGVVLNQRPGGRIGAVLLDLSEKAIPLGHYSFINFSNRELAFMVGEEVFQLPPSKRHLLNATADSEEVTSVSRTQLAEAKSGGQSIVVRAAENQGGQWQPVLNVRWMMSRSARTLVFVYTNPQGEFSVRRIMDKL